MSQEVVVISKDDLRTVVSEGVRLGVAAALRDVSRHREDWMKEQEAAELMGLSRSTLRAWRCEGRGPRYSKRGGLIMYRRGDVDDWITGGSVMTDDSLAIIRRK